MEAYTVTASDEIGEACHGEPLEGRQTDWGIEYAWIEGGSWAATCGFQQNGTEYHDWEEIGLRKRERDHIILCRFTGGSEC